MITTSPGLTRLDTSAALDSARAAQKAKSAEQTPGVKASAQANTTASTQRSQQNKQILQASMDVSIKSADSSLALLYRTAIDRINAVLEPELGPNAISSTPTDQFTPEATAGRILSLSTGFYDAYAAQHTDQDSETVVRNFVDLIRGGFERGFGEARDILSGLNVLGADSPIEQGINQTYALVMKGYDDFLTTKLHPSPAANTTPQDTSAAQG